MRAYLLLSACLLMGCTLAVEVDDGFTLLSNSQLAELGCSPSGNTGDMAPPPAKCAAAKGLAGDNLACVDFNSIPDQTLIAPPPPQLAGWDFNNPPNCWQILNGKLQVKNFSAFASSCGFLLPALSASDYQKYSSFTLAVVHRVDISDVASQSIQVMLGADAPQTRLMTQWTGKGARQQSTLTVSKPDLPNGATNAYQPLFKFNSLSTAGGTYQGWQIESIAVMGNL